MKYFIVFSSFVLLINFPANAARVYSTGSITKLHSYSEQGIFDGNIYVEISVTHASCPGGYWLRKADTPGYRNTVSFLLSALHAGTEVTISALNDAANIWSGAQPAVCRMDQVSVGK